MKRKALLLALVTMLSTGLFVGAHEAAASGQGQAAAAAGPFAVEPRRPFNRF